MFAQLWTRAGNAGLIVVKFDRLIHIPAAILAGKHIPQHDLWIVGNILEVMNRRPGDIILIKQPAPLIPGPLQQGLCQLGPQLESVGNPFLMIQMCNFFHAQHAAYALPEVVLMGV